MRLLPEPRGTVSPEEAEIETDTFRSVCFGVFNDPDDGCLDIVRKL